MQFQHFVWSQSFRDVCCILDGGSLGSQRYHSVQSDTVYGKRRQTDTASEPLQEKRQRADEPPGLIGQPQLAFPGKRKKNLCNVFCTQCHVVADGVLLFNVYLPKWDQLYFLIRLSNQADVRHIIPVPRRLVGAPVAYLTL